MDELNPLPELQEVGELWQITRDGLPTNRHAMTLRQKLKRELEEENSSFALDGTTFYKLRQEEQRVQSDLKQHSRHGQLAKQSELLLASSKHHRSISPLQKVYTPEEPTIATRIIRDMTSHEHGHGGKMNNPSSPTFETLSSSSEDPFAGLSSPSLKASFADPFADSSIHQDSDPFEEFDSVTDAVVLSVSLPLVTPAPQQERERVSRRPRRIRSDDLRGSVPTSRQARQTRLEKLTREIKASHDISGAGVVVHSTSNDNNQKSGIAKDKTQALSVEDLPYTVKRKLRTEMQNLKNELAFYQALYSISQSSLSAVFLAQDSSGRTISHRRHDVERIAYLGQKIEHLRKQCSLDGSRIAILQRVKEDLELRNRMLKQEQRTAELTQAAMMKEKKMLVRCLQKTLQEREHLALDLALIKLDTNKKKLGQLHEDISKRYHEDSRDVVHQEIYEPDVSAVRGELISLYSEIQDCQANIRWTLDGWGIRPGKSFMGNFQEATFA